MIWVPYESLLRSSLALGTTDLLAQLDTIIATLAELHEIEGRKTVAVPRLVNLWRGHEVSLANYGLLSVESLLTQQQSDKAHENLPMGKVLQWHLTCASSGEFSMAPPAWASDDRVHISHRSALYNVNPDRYELHFGKVECIPMFWPDVA